MAPISNFYVSLVDGGFLFTTDADFHDGGDQLFVMLGNEWFSSAKFSTSGHSIYPSFNYFLKFEITINDDDNSITITSDSVFYYNIIEWSLNYKCLNEGNYIDVTAMIEQS